jgi:hypothetical protein
MGQVINLWFDDGISIPPKPRCSEPEPDDYKPPLMGFIMIYAASFVAGVIVGALIW